jgi:hypothetical protein
MSEMKRANPYEEDRRTRDRFVSTIEIGACIIAAVRFIFIGVRSTRSHIEGPAKRRVEGPPRCEREVLALFRESGPYFFSVASRTASNTFWLLSNGKHSCASNDAVISSPAFSHSAE